MCCIDVNSNSNTGNIRNAGCNNSSSVIIDSSASTSIYVIDRSGSSSSSVVCVQLVYLFVPVLVAVII